MDLMPRHILTLTCPDRPGIVHAVSGALLDVGGNIVENAQFGDTDTGLFCMRTEFDAIVDDPMSVADVVSARLGDSAASITVRRADHRPRVLIMVSKFDHCLVDLLYRWRIGDLRVDIPVIVSNHPDCARIAQAEGIPYVHLPIDAASKPQQERALLDLIAEHRIDLVVLARYMQVLSDSLCHELAGRAINIHHSFLPGFKGARPYHQAYERGVKLVGATAHFVTGELDEGPIIEQDVRRVDHAHTAEELTTLGRDTERLVLSRAVGYWAENRVLLVGRKTVVFS
jgi:formyltetrahydrofolate deformylase